MTKTMIQKNIRLSMDFDTFVSKHPRALKSLTGGVHVILTTARDHKLSEANRSIARGSRSGKFVEAHKADGKWSIKPLAR